MYKFTDLYPNFKEELSTREETAIDASEQASVDLDTAPVPIRQTTGNTIFVWLGVGVLFVVLMAFTGKAEV